MISNTTMATALFTTWSPLFNGKDLSGWTHVGPRNMSIIVFFKEISVRYAR